MTSQKFHHLIKRRNRRFGSNGSLKKTETVSYGKLTWDCQGKTEKEVEVILVFLNFRSGGGDCRARWRSQTDAI